MLIVAQQMAATAQSLRELSQPGAHHTMTSGGPGALDVTLLALGVLIVIVTTIYSLLYLIRPGETSQDHIKRRVLEDGREGSR